MICTCADKFQYIYLWVFLIIHASFTKLTYIKSFWFLSKLSNIYKIKYKYSIKLYLPFLFLCLLTKNAMIPVTIAITIQTIVMTIAPCDLIEPSDFSVFVLLMGSAFLKSSDTDLSSLQTMHKYMFYRNTISLIQLMCNKIAFTFLGNLYQQQNNGIGCWFQGKLDLLQKGASLSVWKNTIYLLNWNTKFTNI